MKYIKVFNEKYDGDDAGYTHEQRFYTQISELKNSCSVVTTLDTRKKFIEKLKNDCIDTLNLLNEFEKANAFPLKK